MSVDTDPVVSPDEKLLEVVQQCDFYNGDHLIEVETQDLADQLSSRLLQLAKELDYANPYRIGDGETYYGVAVEGSTFYFTTLPPNERSLPFGGVIVGRWSMK